MHTCNQCHQDMPYHTDDDTFGKYVCVCTNPECQNYALLQISAEQMPKQEIDYYSLYWQEENK